MGHGGREPAASSRTGRWTADAKGRRASVPPTPAMGSAMGNRVLEDGVRRQAVARTPSLTWGEETRDWLEGSLLRVSRLRLVSFGAEPGTGRGLDHGKGEPPSRWLPFSRPGALGGARHCPLDRGWVGERAPGGARCRGLAGSDEWCPARRRARWRFVAAHAKGGSVGCRWHSMSPE